MLTPEQQIFEQIKKAENILITFSQVQNGDSIASALALYLFLKKLDKKVKIAAEKINQEAPFNFLPAYEKISHSLPNLKKFIISLNISNAKIGQIKYKIIDNNLDFVISPKQGFFTHDDIKSRSGEFKYDLIIVIDTSDLESLGSIYDNNAEFFYKVPIINIDHHSYNEEFGQINLVELTSVATAEILFNLFIGFSRDLIDENIATCLLAGIIAKTRSFKTHNITPQALSASSQLISMGGRREEIVKRLYRSRSLNVLKLWGRILARLTGDLDNKIVWSILTKNDFIKTNTSENDLSDIIDELIVNIPQTKTIILIYEPKENEQAEKPQTTGALVYSLKNIDSLNLVKKWNPTGTKKLAKIQLGKNIEEAKNEIIEYVKENFKKIPL